MNHRSLILSLPLCLLATSVVLAATPLSSGPNTQSSVLSPQSSPAAFPILIHRSFKPATAFYVTCSDTFRASEKVDLPGGISTRTQHFRRTTLDADVRIDKIDDQGFPAAQSISIKRFSQQLNNTGQEQSPARALLDPGTELTMTSHAGQLAFTRQDNHDLPDETLAALQSAFQNLPLSDALYGAKDRKTIGNSWPIDKSALLADRTDPNFVDPALITGTVTLKTRRPLAGIDCLQLDGAMLTKDAPTGATAPKESTIALTFTLNLPLDTNLPPMAWFIKRATHAVTENQPLGRGTVTHTVDSETTHETTWTPK
jgi:hypothetical protein